MSKFYASVGGGSVEHDGRTLQTLPLDKAVEKLKPGDTLHVLPGKYLTPITMTSGGKRGAPITISGMVGAVFDGQQKPEAALDAFIPTDADFAFVKILAADHIIVSDLSFDNCWPCAIYLQDVQKISVQDCSIRKGRFAIYAKGRLGRRPCKHVLLERITWIQDPDHDLWQGRIPWFDVKKEKKTSLPKARYMNGAMFGSERFKRGLTVRDCDISHAFNAIRVDGGHDLDARFYNRDITVVGNRFRYIRDNAIEPEESANRLIVANNTFFNVHASFSFDGVRGSHWYFIGNRLLNTRRPKGKDNVGGRIYKFDDKAPYPESPFVTAFNSVQTRTSYAKIGATRNWTHMNNAIGLCRKENNETDCDVDRRMFSGGDKRLTWDKSYQFEGDVSDFPGYPDSVVAAKGFPISGIEAKGGTFVPPPAKYWSNDPDVEWDGSLKVKPNSPTKGASLAMDVEAPDGSTVYVSAGYDVGYPAPPELLSALLSSDGAPVA